VKLTLLLLSALLASTASADRRKNVDRPDDFSNATFLIREREGIRVGKKTFESPYITNKGELKFVSFHQPNKPEDAKPVDNFRITLLTQKFFLRELLRLDL
jgi:hypothetical protein